MRGWRDRMTDEGGGTGGRSRAISVHFRRTVVGSRPVLGCPRASACPDLWGKLGRVLCRGTRRVQVGERAVECGKDLVRWGIGQERVVRLGREREGWGVGQEEEEEGEGGRG